MMNMNLKYDNMHRNGIFYALICIINYVITSISCMLSSTQDNCVSNLIPCGLDLDTTMLAFKVLLQYFLLSMFFF